MVGRCYKMITLLVLLACSASAQDTTWPSPEVEQMYHHAQQYSAAGNYKDAIITYRQAIVLAPAKIALYKELGSALYLSGNYAEAVKTLTPLTATPEADAETYRLLAAAHAALQDTKAAKAAIKNGLARFPSSGMLYAWQGLVYAMEQDTVAALGAWNEGIHNDPAYPANYYHAARIYLAGTNVMWGLLYAEIYLNITTDTTGNEAMKKMLFTGYKTMFDNIAGPASGNGGRNGKVPAASFPAAVQDVYLGLTPVVSDGITTENLTMVRTRFLMDWQTQYAGKYPCALFAYQDHLLRNNLFDIYNEWLFGQAESMTEYNAWLRFHPVEMNILSEKKQAHPLAPLATDPYDHDSLFKKKR